MSWLAVLVALRIVRGPRPKTPTHPTPTTAGTLLFAWVATVLLMGSIAVLGYTSGVLVIALPVTFALVVVSLLVPADLGDIRERQRRR